MNVYRCGENGNLLEQDGGMLVVELHWRDIFRVLSGQFSVQRYQEFKHPAYGFAFEDKFWIMPLSQEDVDEDINHRKIKVNMDSGGDIYLYLNERVGRFAQPYKTDNFKITEICDQPEQFTERGLRVIRMVGLSALEAERRHKVEWPNLWQERARDYL